METIEGAAETNSEKHHYAFGQQSEFYQLGFIEGAKWHQERSYSEEEVIALIHKRMIYTLGDNYQETTTLKWFEQFKKKYYE